MADLRSPIELRCEHLRDPLGVDSAAPWLSWRLPATDRAVEPVACQVRVAGSVAALQQGHADVWDSGWCTAEAVGAVSYGGPPLVSRQRCWWQVRVRVAEGDESAWSVPAWWEMGLLDADDWHAAWVGLPTEPEGPCPLLRRTFSLAEAPRQARVYVTALGVYELRINGEVVGNRRLAPEWTDYRRRIQYQVHDVTELLQRGENAVGLVLAEGWYLGLLGWAQHGRRENYGPPPPRALAQLEVIDAAGQTHRVVTDRDWRGDEGPIRASSLYRGEHHDARLDPLGWDTAGFADDTWQAVEVHPAPPGRLVAQPCPPIRATKTLAPRRRHTVGADVVRFDFGQNLSGVCQIEVTGPAGAELTLRHGEVLEPDGTLHTANLRKAVSIDRFVLRGAADGTAETWSPRFTCHGFRHVELSGPPAALTEARVSALAVHSDLEPTARFRCSHEMLNRLHEAIHWTIRSNLHAMITDCPQRDERFGWLGDGQAVLPTACYHFDMVALLRKFGADLLDAQHSDGAMPDYCPWVELGPDVVPDHGSPGYMDACVVFPWLAHWFYGDRTMLSRHLDAMLAYLRYIERRNPDHLWRNARGNNYGDWVNAGGKSDKTVIATLHWYRSADLTARAAAAAGRPDVERIARPMADAVAAALRQSCFDGERFRDGTQAIHAMALMYGLVPARARAAVGRSLVDDLAACNWHPSTGIFGTAALLPALSETGHDAEALRTLLQRDSPSWGHMLEHGATTMWERWRADELDASMNSHSHPALGSVGSWLMGYLAGIRPMKPGFARFRIDPRIPPAGEVSWVEASYRSVVGEIAVAWARRGHGTALHATVPAGTRAVVTLPTGDAEAVTEQGRALTDVPGVGPARQVDGRLEVEVGSGSYAFTVEGRPQASASQSGGTAR